MAEYRAGSHETYGAFRARMQRENPDPTRCAHGMALRTRCSACEDESKPAPRYYLKNGRRVRVIDHKTAQKSAEAFELTYRERQALQHENTFAPDYRAGVIASRARY